ncbi:hypothetical protein D3C86_2246150 [compost metagenome]
MASREAWLNAMAITVANNAIVPCITNTDAAEKITPIPNVDAKMMDKNPSSNDFVYKIS